MIKTLLWAILVLMISLFYHLLLEKSLSGALKPETQGIWDDTFCPKRFHGARRLLFFEHMDINTASLQDLVIIPGIGKKRASSILIFRQNMGFVLDIDELEYPEGPLPPGLVDKIRGYIR